MSKLQHPLELVIEDSRNPSFRGDLYREPSHTDFDRYLSHSSSPTRSSSPPSTPYSSRRDSGYAYISSSPDVAGGSLYRAVSGRPTLSSKSFFSSLYPNGTSIHDRHYAAGHGFQKDACDRSLESDDYRYNILSDGEEEDIDDALAMSSMCRTTSFRVSAERGLWRSDLLPVKTPCSTLQSRNPVPTFLREPTSLPLTTRTVSEPASSNISQMTGFYSQKTVPTTELSDSVVWPSRISVDEFSSPRTLPPLIANSEGDVDVDLDAPDVPSSPLPPSSPPLSPLHRSISIYSRSSSPLIFDFAGSSSPLSELPDDYDSDDSHVNEEGSTLSNALGMQISEQNIELSLKSEDDMEEWKRASELQASCCDPQNTQDSSPSKLRQSPLPCLEDSQTFSPAPATVSSIGTHSHEDSTLAPNFDDRFSSTAVPASSFRDVDPEKEEGPDVQIMLNSITPFPADESMTVDDCSQHLEKSNALKDKNGIMYRFSNVVQASTNRFSRKSRAFGETARNSKGRATKLKNVERDDRKSCGGNSKKVDGKKRTDREDEENVKNDGSSSVTGSRHKRMKRMDGDTVPSRSTKSIPKPRRRRPPSVLDEEEIDEPLDAEARELHSTVCGLVIETMATSRASSLPASSIFKLVMSSQPSLKSQRSEHDWLGVFERVLRDGAAGRGSGVFGKVESSGKDESDRPLEAQWFYVPERDEDQERAALIRSMMPRPGKRTETMKYKQYYWRPLEKISKWDPEDAL